MFTLILATSGLSRVQLSRVVGCFDVLFFEQNRYGSKLRPPFQVSAIKHSKTITFVQSLTDLAHWHRCTSIDVPDTMTILFFSPLPTFECLYVNAVWM